jgi:membrane-associated phospholipid phosphatase
LGIAAGEYSFSLSTMTTSEFLIILMARWLVYLSLWVLPYLWMRGKHRGVLRVLATLAIAMVIEEGLDSLITAPRPFVAGGFEPLVTMTPDEFYTSFPSGHATFMAALGVAVFLIDRYAGIVTLFCAVLVGAGRVLAGVHYPTDILGGFVVGGMAAGLVSFLDARYTDRLLKKLRRRLASS